MNKIAIVSIVAVVATVVFMTMSPSADSALEAEFQTFLAEYSRSYNSQSEYDFRLNIFKNNLEEAARLQKDDDYAIFGVTQFSDWTEEEFNVLNGDRDELEDGNCPIKEVDTSFELSGAIDHRSHFAPIQNQKHCGSCWSFAATATFEAYWHIKHNKHKKASEQYPVDCDYNSHGCRGGGTHGVYTFLAEPENAHRTLDSYPYTADDQSCRSSGKTIGNTKGCIGVAVYNEKAIYAQLKNGPVSVSVDAKAFHSYKGGILRASKCGLNTNHAVVIVGLGHDSKKDMYYWLVRNSWGSSWGEKGYIRLEYGKNACDISKKPAYTSIK
jgi:C1A family cysteine protease